MLHQNGHLQQQQQQQQEQQHQHQQAQRQSDLSSPGQVRQAEAVAAAANLLSTGNYFII